MPIISISRSTCSKGKFIAEKVAERLGYECISKEIILEASDVFNVTEVKLAKAFHDGPSFLEKIRRSKGKYVSYINAAMLNHVKSDNVVYHGLAGHYFLQDIRHAIKIRIVTDFGSRVSEKMARENVTGSMAKRQLEHDDSERLKWGRYIYGIDTISPGLYDLVINLNQMSVDECIDMICTTASFASFSTTPESAVKLENLATVASARALLYEKYSDAVVSADGGHLCIVFPRRVTNRQQVISEIKKILGAMPDIEEINISVEEEVTPASLMYMANR